MYSNIKIDCKKKRPQLYNSRKVGDGGSQFSGSLLVFFGVSHLDRDNLNALLTWPKRNHKQKPETMKRWAQSMDTCSRFVQDTANMSEHSGEREVTSREKEKPSPHFERQG